MSGRIVNGANVPLGSIGGTVPDVSGALQDYFQKMVFTPLVKTVSGFQVVEDAFPIEFQGTIQPYRPRDLALRPEGQRAWSYFQLHAEPGIILKVDDVVEYLGKQFRVVSKTNFLLYGYVLYELATDWIGAGP
jgi:hypothetical protein